MPEISIIILTYNSAPFIKKLLLSLFQKYKKELEEGRIEIIVADNASSDSSQEAISTINHQRSNIKIIKNSENLGFAKGINKASKQARGKYLLFLNPDTEFESGDLFEMSKIMEKDEKVGVVGGKIFHERGKAENSAGKLYGPLNTLFLALGLENLLGVRFSPKIETGVDFVSGGFMMVRSKVFEKLSGFDENLFMYFEDVEFCYRAKKEGIKVVFTPKAVIKHSEHGSSSRSFAIKNIYKGILYFNKKHMGKSSYLFVKSILVLKAGTLVIVGKIINNEYLSKTYREALSAI